MGIALYCFADDSKDKEIIGVVCFENKEEVIKKYVEIVNELCKGRKATEVFEIKGNKVELKGSKLDRKGIPFCELLKHLFKRCVKSLSELNLKGVKVLIVDSGTLNKKEEVKVKRKLGCKVKSFRSHLRKGPHSLCGVKVELSWEACGVQIADLVARCCYKALTSR